MSTDDRTVSGQRFLDRGKFSGKGLPGNPPCMFCGRPSDSKEDIIPSWIARQSFTPPGSVNPVTYSVHGTEMKKWSSQTLAFLKVKTVCENCNNTWMSRIEDVAKTHLVRMMQGQPTPLDVAAQLDLATWACLKVEVWEAVAEQGAVSRPTDRSLMHSSQQPPGYALVIAARVPSSNYSEFSLQQVFLEVERTPGAAHVNISATAIALGDFVVWVILNPTRKQVGFAPSPGTDDTITIFPPAYGILQWPPRKSLSEEELRQVWRRYLVIQEEHKVGWNDSTESIGGDNRPSAS
jgi:hypothetical protein